MIKKKMISVILSVFNDENNITNSIESILNQTYKNIELLIIDDGSTDETYQKILSIKDDRIILYRNKENLGLTKSLNILISKASGEFIARQDSDDISLPIRFEKQLEFMKKNNLSVCTSRAIVKETKRSIPRFSHYLPSKLVIKYKNPFIHGTLLIKKNVLNNVGNYDENYIYAQDYKLFLDLMKKGVMIKIMKEKLYVLNMKNNISSNKLDLQDFYFKKAKNDMNF